MTQYAVVIDRSPDNYGAWVPDLDGCVSTGQTIEEVKANIADAIEMHIEVMREHGEAVPPPSAQVAIVQVASYAANRSSESYTQMCTGSHFVSAMSSPITSLG
jgi:predicted RNase H-like HicB family nuclease